MTDAVEVPLFMERERFIPSAKAAALRDSGGIEKVRVTLGAGEAWLISRYEDVRAVLSDSVNFSNRITDSMLDHFPDLTEDERRRARKGQLLTIDPPDHSRMRRILTPEFTMRRIRRLEPRIDEIVADHLDSYERAGPGADLVSHVALPIPSLVICELLGVPYSERSEFQKMSATLLDTSLDQVERREVGRLNVEYMRGLVERAKADPGDDILGMLVREHRDAIDDDELVNLATLLLTAGHETTANMLGIGTFALLTHPEQLARLRDNLDDSAYVHRAIEELLRYLSVVHSGTARTVVNDIEIGGHRLRAGEQLVLGLATANHDPRFVTDGATLDLEREPTAHVAFGHGAHHCLGAPLARAELRRAFPELLRRFPDLRLATPAEEVRFRPHHVVYGVWELPLTWGAA